VEDINGSIIKVILRNNIKNYLFYLTYNNRADILLNQKQDFESSISKSPLLNKKEVKIDDYKNQLSFYKNWRESLNSELSGSNIEAIEMIFTYKREFNSFMALIMGRLKWKKLYKKITQDIVQESLPNNKANISFYHSTDSQGYREHNHTLVYPYEKKNNKILRSTSISPEILELMKLKFKNKQEELEKRYQKEFNKLKKVLKNKR